MYTAAKVDALLEQLKSRGASKAEIVRALSAACLGWPYVFGAWGCLCTPENRRTYASRCRAKHADYADKIVKACPVLSGKQRTCEGCPWNGVRCFDCRGFTHWLLEQVGLQLYGDTVTSQWETKSNWAAQGDIADMPENLVCCIFRKGHTGMYLGNWIADVCFDSDTGQLYPDRGPQIIHCSTMVKEDSLPGNPKWLRWGIPAGLYSTDELRKAGVNVEESRNVPTIRRGATGDLVIELQKRLNNEMGAGLTVDGVFGKKTEEAVKAFQSTHGLKADGVVGPKTWAALGVTEWEEPMMSVPPGEEPEIGVFPGEGPDESPEKPPDMVSVSRADLEVWADVLEEMARDIREQLG